MKKIALICLSGLLLSNCKKAEQLPSLTHEGKNIFSIKVDKDVYTFDEPLIFGGPLPDGVFFDYYVDSTVRISAQNSSIVVDLAFKYLNQTGVYSLYWDETSCRVGDSYYIPDSVAPGYVNVLYANDTVIAGTFQFTGYYTDPTYGTKYNKTFTGNFDFRKGP